MTRFAGMVGAGLALGLATYLAGCQSCDDVPDYVEDGTGSAVTASGAVTLSFDMSDGRLNFVAADATYPTIALDLPSAEGSYPLTSLHARICATASDCSPAQGTIVYATRRDLAPDEFDAQITFSASSSGTDATEAPAIAGWAQVTASDDDETVCTGGFGGGAFQDE